MAIALSFLTGAAGCGPKLYPVRGKVAYPDGKPLTEGMVVFESKGKDNLVMARGEIQADGSYELSTYKAGDGAMPGIYRVMVASKSDPNAVDKPNRPPPFDSRFMAFNTSGLEFEVKAESNEFPIRVARSRR
jgi:hypothetical protein